MTTTDWPMKPEPTMEAAMAQDPVKTLEEIRALLNAQDEAGRKLILDWIIAENAAKKPTRGRAKK